MGKLRESLNRHMESRAPVRTALLHGDLWSGNVYAAPDGVPVLIDPAVYLGVAGVDLAMTQLFGGFPADFLDAYLEAAKSEVTYDPLERDLYQLYPVLVHANLFGGAYVSDAQRLIGKLSHP
jgi:fructosamine-3-kinase